MTQSALRALFWLTNFQNFHKQSTKNAKNDNGKAASLDGILKTITDDLDATVYRYIDDSAESYINAHFGQDKKAAFEGEPFHFLLASKWPVFRDFGVFATNLAAALAWHRIRSMQNPYPSWRMAVPLARFIFLWVVSNFYV